MATSELSSLPSLPLLSEIIPSSIDFGTNFLIEFQPHSLWYETSLTIAAHALKNGVRTDYHTLAHIPGEVRRALTRLDLDVKKLEEDDTLRIIDTYTVTTGLGVPERPAKGRVPFFQTQSVKLSDWSIGISQSIKTGIVDEDKRRLHIDDNTSVLAQYNEEKLMVDFWRTRGIPQARSRELVMFHSLVAGVYSEAFYRQFESICDGIIDFQSQERGEQIEQMVRVRMIRGKSYDSRWRRLRLMENGEVALAT